MEEGLIIPGDRLKTSWCVAALILGPMFVLYAADLLLLNLDTRCNNMEGFCHPIEFMIFCAFSYPPQANLFWMVRVNTIGIPAFPISTRYEWSTNDH